jgi:Zn-dependent protease with chaperone function
MPARQGVTSLAEQQANRCIQVLNAMYAADDVDQARAYVQHAPAITTDSTEQATLLRQTIDIVASKSTTAEMRAAIDRALAPIDRAWEEYQAASGTRRRGLFGRRRSAAIADDGFGLNTDDPFADMPKPTPHPKQQPAPQEKEEPKPEPVERDEIPPPKVSEPLPPPPPAPPEPVAAPPPPSPPVARPAPPPQPVVLQPAHALEAVKGPSGIDGIPATYDDGRAWLRSGLRQQPRAVIAALFFAWSGLWIALWAAAMGAIVGPLIMTGIFAPVNGNFFAVTVTQAVTPIAFVVGLVFGAIGGFLIVVREIIFHNPGQWIGAMIGGSILAFIIVVTLAAYERLFLRWRGYRRLSRDEVRRIAPLVKDVADGMNLDGLPRFAMTDSPLPGAWAHMRTIVLATGLLQSLDDGELRAVLAHELYHWRSGDTVGGTLIWACAWPLALVCNLGLWIAGSGRQPPPRRGPLLKFVGWFIAWPAWVIIRFFLTPLAATTMRQYEYRADAAARQLGYAPQLISALRKLTAFESPRSGWERAMQATHPPTELRIEALQEPKPDDPIYQEDELGRPSWAEVKRILTPFKPGHSGTSRSAAR